MKIRGYIFVVAQSFCTRSIQMGVSKSIQGILPIGEPLLERVTVASPHLAAWTWLTFLFIKITSQNWLEKKCVALTQIKDHPPERRWENKKNTIRPASNADTKLAYTCVSEHRLQKLVSPHGLQNRTLEMPQRLSVVTNSPLVLTLPVVLLWPRVAPVCTQPSELFPGEGSSAHSHGFGPTQILPYRHPRIKTLRNYSGI